MNYYEKYSQPLKRISVDDIPAGGITYNELGTCVQKNYIKGEVYFVDLIESVLRDGETISDLSNPQLTLFWALSRTKLKKLDEDETNYRGKRKRVLY